MRNHLANFWNWVKYPTNLALLALALLPMIVVQIFIARYNMNMPRIDHGWNAVRFAPGIVDGEFAFMSLLQVHYGHLVLLPNIQTSLFVWLTDWNVRLETYMAFVVALVCYGLLLRLMYRAGGRQAVAWALVPFSALLFALHHDALWIVGLFIQWLYPPLLLLVGLMVITGQNNRWFALWVAAGLALLATFSNGNGIVLWGALGVSLWFARRWPWWVFGLWAAAAVGSLLVYIELAGIGVSVAGADVATRQSETVSVDQFGLLVRFVLAILGNMFMAPPRNWGYASLVGLVGLGLFVANAVLLWPTRQKRQVLTVWLPLFLYGGGSALVVGLARRDFYREGATAALLDPYRMMSAFFWVGVVAVMILAWVTPLKDRWRWQTLQNRVNRVMALSLLALYPFTTYMEFQDELFQSRQYHETCYVYFMFTQRHDNPTDSRCQLIYAVYTNYLAAKRLAMFKHIEPTQIIAEYQPEDVVLVESSHSWINYHARDWLLAGVPPERVLSFTQDVPRQGTLVLPPNFQTGINRYSDLHPFLNEFLEDAGTIWVVRPALETSIVPELWEALAVNPAAVPETLYVVADTAAFTIQRYER